jgi:hypothetical protein
VSSDFLCWTIRSHSGSSRWKLQLNGPCSSTCPKLVECGEIYQGQLFVMEMIVLCERGCFHLVLGSIPMSAHIAPFTTALWITGGAASHSSPAAESRSFKVAVGNRSQDIGPLELLSRDGHSASAHCCSHWRVSKCRESNRSEVPEGEWNAEQKPTL